MTNAQVVEMSVTVNNSPIQDYIQPDDHTYWVLKYLRLGVFCSVKKKPLNFLFVLLLCIPANSPGFPGSLQVFHQISRSPSWSTKSPG